MRALQNSGGDTNCMILAGQLYVYMHVVALGRCLKDFEQPR